MTGDLDLLSNFWSLKTSVGMFSTYKVIQYLKIPLLFSNLNVHLRVFKHFACGSHDFQKV